MSETPTEPTATPPYASPADVRDVLGTAVLPNRPDIPAVDAYLSIAHAEVLDTVGGIYGRTLPTWQPDALDALRWAEAQLAAAGWLDMTRAMRNDSSDVADKLRASAYRTLAGGLPGQPPGDAGEPLPDGAAPVAALPVMNGPVVAGGLSNFADPYVGATVTPWPYW